MRRWKFGAHLLIFRFGASGTCCVSRNIRESIVIRGSLELALWKITIWRFSAVLRCSFYAVDGFVFLLSKKPSVLSPSVIGNERLSRWGRGWRTFSMAGANVASDNLFNGSEYMAGWYTVVFHCLRCVKWLCWTNSASRHLSRMLWFAFPEKGYLLFKSRVLLVTPPPPQGFRSVVPFPKKM